MAQDADYFKNLTDSSLSFAILDISRALNSFADNPAAFNKYANQLMYALNERWERNSNNCRSICKVL